MHGVHSCFLIFIYGVFVQDFHWNIGGTEGEIQTKVQENVGLRWVLLGLGQTLGPASPGVALPALSFLRVVRLGVVC